MSLLSRGPKGPKYPYFICGIALIPLLSACVETVNLPYVGDCAEYPEGLYDYGDLGIGSCISGPVDLYAHDEGEDYRLYVSNSNANLLFRSGNILSLDGDVLNAAAESGGDYLIHELIEGPEYAYPTRSFSGQMAWDPERDVLYYANRLSYTTSQGTDDRVEAVNLNDGKMSVFEDFDLETGDGTFATVGQDPFTMARHESTGILYVLDVTSHDITYFDTDPADTDTVRYGRTTTEARYPKPRFIDSGPLSHMELSFLEAIPEGLPATSFELTYLEPGRRLFYPVEYEGTTAIGMADSGDGLLWRPDAINPILTPGDEEDAWDRDGLTLGDSYNTTEDYLLWYTGYRDGVSAIGLATAGGTWTGSWGKYDVGSDDLTDNDAILFPTEDYEVGGVSHPAVLRPTLDAFRMWYNATDADGVTRIAGAQGETAVGNAGGEWEREGILIQAETPGESVADPRVFIRAFGNGGFAMFYVEGDLESQTCVKYATYDLLDSGYVWTPGGIDQLGPGCLISETDGLPPLLRRPLLASAGTELVLWIYGADSADGPWSMYQLTSFNGFDWELVGEADFAPPTSIPSQENLPVLSSGALVNNPLAESGMRIQRDGEADYLITPMGVAYAYAGLTLVALEGHVLSVPSYGENWWGAETGVLPGTFTRLGAPAIVPSTSDLVVSSFMGEEAQGQLGLAHRAQSAESGEDLPLWQVDTDCTDDCSGLLVAEEGLSYDDPWLIQGRDGSGDLWLYATENDGVANRIIRMVSPDDGMTWGPAEVVLSASEAGQSGVSAPTLVEGHDDRLYLWYVSEELGGNVIAMATSDDGLNFTRENSGGLALGEPGSWDDLWLDGPSVVWDPTGTPLHEDIADEQGLYRMWYAANDGLSVKIGYADGIVENGEIVWYRYRQDGAQIRSANLTSSNLGWDAEGVINPYVIQDGPNDFKMWFEGELVEGAGRIGYATSVNGVYWTREALSGSANDRYTFSSAPERTAESEDPRDDATLSLELGTSTFSGISATELEMIPMPYTGDRLYADGTPVATESGYLQCFAVVTTRYLPSITVVDVFDDSASRFADGKPGPCVELTNPDLFAEADETFVDANYNFYEVGYRLSTGCQWEGTRTVHFSPDGELMFLTSAFPDRLLIADARAFVDDIDTELNEQYLPILGSVEVGRSPQANCEQGDARDLESDISQDIGPTGLEVSADGRYVFVANGNEHSVYTIDLQRGTYGQVVAIAEDIGDLPFDITLTPDGRWLMVGNYVGQLEDNVANSSLVIISASPDDEDFGQVVATIKNREL